MLITTTHELDGYVIKEYRGIVMGEAIIDSSGRSRTRRLGVREVGSHSLGGAHEQRG